MAFMSARSSALYGLSSSGGATVDNIIEGVAFVLRNTSLFPFTGTYSIRTQRW
jgi:hypothetical protein